MASPTEWNDSVPHLGQSANASNFVQDAGYALDSTVQRSELLAPGHQGPEPAQAPAAPAGKKRLWLGLGSGLVLLAAVVVGIVIFINVGAPEQDDPLAGQPSTPPTALVVGADVPAVTELTATPKNGGSEWTWTNPEPQEGDKYLWASVSAVDSGEFKPIAEAKAFVVNGSNDESCISVKLVRKNGQTSPETKQCS